MIYQCRHDLGTSGHNVFLNPEPRTVLFIDLRAPVLALNQFERLGQLLAALRPKCSSLLRCYLDLKGRRVEASGPATHVACPKGWNASRNTSSTPSAHLSASRVSSTPNRDSDFVPLVQCNCLLFLGRTVRGYSKKMRNLSGSTRPSHKP